MLGISRAHKASPGPSLQVIVLHQALHPLLVDRYTTTMKLLCHFVDKEKSQYLL
jgi:hypothetical protein